MLWDLKKFKNKISFMIRKNQKLLILDFKQLKNTALREK